MATAVPLTISNPSAARRGVPVLGWLTMAANKLKLLPRKDWTNRKGIGWEGLEGRASFCSVRYVCLCVVGKVCTRRGLDQVPPGGEVGQGDV